MCVRSNVRFLIGSKFTPRNATIIADDGKESAMHPRDHVALLSHYVRLSFAFCDEENFEFGAKVLGEAIQSM